jgi:hypothetical protein
MEPRSCLKKRTRSLMGEWLLLSCPVSSAEHDAFHSQATTVLMMGKLVREMEISLQWLSRLDADKMQNLQRGGGMNAYLFMGLLTTSE